MEAHVRKGAQRKGPSRKTSGAMQAAAERAAAAGAAEEAGPEEEQEAEVEEQEDALAAYRFLKLLATQGARAAAAAAAAADGEAEEEAGPGEKEEGAAVVAAAGPPRAAAAAGDFRTPEYWRRLAPQLAGGSAFRFGEDPGLLRKSAAAAAADVAEEGYAVLTSDKWTGRTRKAVRGELMAGLEAAILALERAGWPATFVIAYDAVWDLLRHAGPLCRGAAGPNAFNGDILAWCVDPAKGQSGFSPHRDRQPEDVAASFRADGTPRYATMWIAVTPATPHNSCLYMLPRHCDPGYLAGDTDAERDPLQVALKDKEAFQNIRAVPLDRGDAVLFTHRIIHWGSAGKRERGDPPRISISFGCAAPEFEPAYFKDDVHLAGASHPPLELRLALAAAQMVRPPPRPPSFAARTR